MSWDGGDILSRELVEACHELGLSFEQRLHLYQAQVRAIHALGGYPSVWRHPKDLAWALTATPDPQRTGRDDALEAEPKFWAFRQLLKQGHPSAEAYHRGYASVSRDVFLECLTDTFDHWMKVGPPPYPLHVAMKLRAWVDAGETLPPQVQARIEEQLGVSVSCLLDQEASGELYPHTIPT